MSKLPDSLERFMGLLRKQADGAKQELVEAHAALMRLQQAHGQLERYRCDYEISVHQSWQDNSMKARFLKDQLAFVAQLRDAEHKSNIRCQQEDARRQNLQQSWQELQRYATMMENLCTNRRSQAERLALKREEQHDLDERLKRMPWPPLHDE
jgi:hypothetical protein